MLEHVLARLLEQGFRASVDLRAEKIGAKIRDAQLEKIPAMLVVGAKEAETRGGLVPRSGAMATRGRCRFRKRSSGWWPSEPAGKAGRRRRKRRRLLSTIRRKITLTECEETNHAAAACGEAGRGAWHQPYRW